MEEKAKSFFIFINDRFWGTGPKLVEFGWVGKPVHLSFRHHFGQKEFYGNELESKESGSFLLNFNDMQLVAIEHYLRAKIPFSLTWKEGRSPDDCQPVITLRDCTVDNHSVEGKDKWWKFLNKLDGPFPPEAREVYELIFDTDEVERFDQESNDCTAGI